MPDATAIQNTILQSQLKAANLILSNTTAEIGGNLTVDWTPATQWYLNIQALVKQYNLGDYTSTQTLVIYDCLNNLLGLDTTVIVVDPNYQPPGGQIVVINPSTYLSPVVLKFSDFDPASQQGDGGRTTYINSNWKGINPFMAFTSPALTGLEYGTDYTLLPNGGFTLLDTGNMPEIYSGGLITVYSYGAA